MTRQHDAVSTATPDPRGEPDSRADAEPRYYQVKRALLDLIADQAPGTGVPPERVLAERYRTSRTTVRQALAELTAEGRLKRTQGRGTFVAPPKIVQVRQLTSFTDDLHAQGQMPSSRVLDVARVPADRLVAERLDVPEGTRVNRVRRLRLVDGEPLALETAHLPGRLPRLAAQLARHDSLYATLRDCYGLEIAAVEDTVETVLATPAEANLLRVDTGLPMLLLHRLAWDSDNRPVEWTRSVFRGDRFRFVARASTPRLSQF